MKIKCNKSTESIKLWCVQLFIFVFSLTWVHVRGLIFVELHGFYPMTDCQISPGIKKASKIFQLYTQKSFLSLLPICVWIHPPAHPQHTHTHTQWKKKNSAFMQYKITFWNLPILHTVMSLGIRRIEKLMKNWRKPEASRELGSLSTHTIWLRYWQKCLAGTL